MVEVEYFEIDDRKYMITNEIEENNVIYYFLSNIDLNEDVMVRKSNKSDLTKLLPLDSEGELFHAVSLLEETLITEIN